MATSKRIEALDVMRGIAVAAMIMFNNPGSWSAAYAPLKHAAWNGLTPTDLAYPFFMFIMGVSICLSLRKYAGNNGKAFGKIVKRTLLLYLVGLFMVSFGPLCRGTFSFASIRVLGVLQRLAIVYFFGATLAVCLPRKVHLPLAAAILVLYIAIMQVGGGYAHNASNLVARIDVAVLGAQHMITENGIDGKFAFEPEGLLSTIPCIAHVLFGIFAGGILLIECENKERVRRIAIFGTILLFCGFLLQYLDPVNKKLWTSSYTLVTCGGASLLLALLTEIIDIRQYSRWTGFFKVFGTNALFAYVLASMMATLFGVFNIKPWINANIIRPAFSWGGDCFCSLCYALLYIALMWLIVLPLYKKKIYIKL